MIKAEISLYPMITEEIRDLANLSRRFLDEHGLDYDFRLGNTSLNTSISGTADEVWNALRHLFQENCGEGYDIVMVTTLTTYDEA